MITHDFTRPVDTTPPKVCVVVVHHRPLDHPYMVEAIESLTVQSYANLECITVDNQDNSLTMGQARNQAVQHTDADLVAFMAEEDMMTLDTVQAMVDLYTHARNSDLKALVHVTTHLIALLDSGQRAIMPNMQAPGMYERAYLLNNPFDPALDERVDGAQLRCLHNLAQVKGQPVTFATTHHYGYILRVHPFRRDGIRVNVQ